MDSDHSNSRGNGASESAWQRLRLAFAAGAERLELSRTPNPSHTLDAVVIRYNPGAMSSYAYFVEIVPYGMKDNLETDAYIAYHGYRGNPEKVTWLRDNIVTIIRQGNDSAGYTDPVLITDKINRQFMVTVHLQ